MEWEEFIHDPRRNWGKFLEKLSPLILKITTFKAHNDYDLAMDMYLYVLEKLKENDFRRIKSFRGKSKFTTWLTVVTNNLCNNYLRKENRKKTILLSFESFEHLSGNKEINILEMNSLEKKRLLENFKILFEKLPPRDQLLLRYFYVDNFNAAKIAEIMDFKNPKSVYRRLDKVKKKLRKQLQKLGYSGETIKQIID